MSFWSSMLHKEWLDHNNLLKLTQKKWLRVSHFSSLVSRLTKLDQLNLHSVTAVQSYAFTCHQKKIKGHIWRSDQKLFTDLNSQSYLWNFESKMLHSVLFQEQRKEKGCSTSADGWFTIHGESSGIGVEPLYRSRALWWIMAINEFTFKLYTYAKLILSLTHRCGLTTK